MSRNESIPGRISGVSVAFALLACILAGCPQQSDSPPTAVPSDSVPPAASPAVTGSTETVPVPEVEPAPPAPEPPKEAAAVTPKEAAAEVTAELGTDVKLSKEMVEMVNEVIEREKTSPAQEAEAPAPPKTEPAEPAMPEVERPLTKDEFDWGEPLVEGLGDNDRLNPKQPIWLSKDRKSVIMQSLVCQRRAPLEMFACLYQTKEHESVLTVPVKAFIVHAGLLAVGAKQGTPVRWEPYAPPTGSEIEITVLWKDAEGKVQKARAQEWVRDMTTGKAMAQPWVFAGSKMWKDEETKREYYLADQSGDLICVSNFASATLDVPIQSSDSNADLRFEAFTEHIPDLSTPVTLVLTPKIAPEKAAPEKAAPEKAAPEKAAPEKAAPEKAAPEKSDAEK